MIYFVAGRCRQFQAGAFPAGQKVRIFNSKKNGEPRRATKKEWNWYGFVALRGSPFFFVLRIL
jgi:hypothetical protein